VVKKEYSYTSTPPMGRTACTEPQCLYKGALYFFYGRGNIFCAVCNIRKLGGSDTSRDVVLCSWSGRPARPRTQHDCHHDTKVKPEAATAVIELLMMGGKTPETF